MDSVCLNPLSLGPRNLEFPSGLQRSRLKVEGKVASTGTAKVACARLVYDRDSTTQNGDATDNN